jgi:deoxyribose-phosphate aldolase
MTVTAKSTGGIAGSEPWSLPDVARSETTLRTFLHGLPGWTRSAPGQSGDARTRSIKTSAKQWAIDLAIGWST